MLPLIESTLDLFGFTKFQTMIAMVCFIALLMSFGGGLMFNVIIANMGPRKERPIKDRMSFRMLLMLELALVMSLLQNRASPC